MNLHETVATLPCILQMHPQILFNLAVKEEHDWTSHNACSLRLWPSCFLIQERARSKLKDQIIFGEISKGIFYFLLFSEMVFVSRVWARS